MLNKFAIVDSITRKVIVTSNSNSLIDLLFESFSKPMGKYIKISLKENSDSNIRL